MEGATKSIAEHEFHDTSDKLSHASEEHGNAKDGLVRTNSTQRVGVGKPFSCVSKYFIARDSFQVSLPSTTLVKPENECSQSEANQAKRSWVTNLAQSRLINLGDHGLVRSTLTIWVLGVAKRNILVIRIL